MRCFMLLVLAFSFAASALIMGPIEVYGKVIRYDSKSVVLSQNNGTRIKIPKSAVLKDFKKLQTGYCVSAKLEKSEWEKSLKEAGSP